MATVASDEVTMTATRHFLHVTDEGAPGVPSLTPGSLATVATGSIALACAGGDLGTLVRLEHHDEPPSDPTTPWQLAAQSSWKLTAGHLGVGNLEGLLQRTRGLGLSPGVWQVRVLVTGQPEAAALEDEVLDRLARDEDFDTPNGPERWLVQVWP